MQKFVQFLGCKRFCEIIQWKNEKKTQTASRFLRLLSSLIWFIATGGCRCCFCVSFSGCAVSLKSSLEHRPFPASSHLPQSDVHRQVLLEPCPHLIVPERQDCWWMILCLADVTILTRCLPRAKNEKELCGNEKVSWRPRQPRPPGTNIPLAH